MYIQRHVFANHIGGKMTIFGQQFIQHIEASLSTAQSCLEM